MFRISSIILTIVLFAACKREKADKIGLADTEPVPAGINIKPVPPVTMYNQDEPFSILCETEKQYGCANYAINYTKRQEGNIINITFNHIEKPAICLTAIGPAKATIPIGDIAPGSYELRFAISDMLASCQLIVTPGSYELKANTTGLVNIALHKVMRIPAHTLWGEMWDHTGDDIQPIYQKVDSGLRATGATPVQLPAGNYWHFTVGANGAPVTQTPGAVSYCYQYTGNISTLAPVLQAYNSDSLTIRLQNADGQLITNRK